jgi:hypothetical protein
MATPIVVLTACELAGIRRLVDAAACCADEAPPTVVADVAALLLADDERARGQLALLRAEHAGLLAAARAAVAAARDGHPDPLACVRLLLAERGQLPAAGQHPQQLLALAGVIA